MNVPLKLAGFLFASTVALLGGEKIQFSAPSERQEQPIDIRPSRHKASSSALDSAPAAMAPGSSVPIAVPRLTHRPQEDPDKNRNWLSSKPEDSTPSMEDFLKTKKFNSFGTDKEEKSQTTFFGKPLDATVRISPSFEQANQGNLDERSGPSQLFPSNADPQFQGASSWETVFSANKLNTVERPGALGDFWGHNLNSSSLTEQNHLQKRPVADFFRPQGALDPINSLQDITRQPANPVQGLGADVFSRTQQTSFGDQWNGGASPLTGSRASVVENVNARSLGRVSSPAEIKVNTPVFHKPQPAILPFPTRPGQLFR